MKFYTFFKFVHLHELLIPTQNSNKQSFALKIDYF